jgi:hypothetical protein
VPLRVAVEAPAPAVGRSEALSVMARLVAEEVEVGVRLLEVARRWTPRVWLLARR